MKRTISRRTDRQDSVAAVEAGGGREGGRGHSPHACHDELRESERLVVRARPDLARAPLPSINESDSPAAPRAPLARKWHATGDAEDGKRRLAAGAAGVCGCARTGTLAKQQSKRVGRGSIRRGHAVSGKFRGCWSLLCFAGSCRSGCRRSSTWREKVCGCVVVSEGGCRCASLRTWRLLLSCGVYVWVLSWALPRAPPARGRGCKVRPKSLLRRRAKETSREATEG